MIKDTVFLRIAEVAHNNNLTVEDFLDSVEKVFRVDNSTLPRDKNGDILYPDGKVGLEIDMDADLKLQVFELAAQRGITSNDLIVQALVAKAEQVIAEHDKKID